MWPFLIDNLKELIRELQEFAERRFTVDEMECPQRAARITTANNASPSSHPNTNSNKQPRALSDITNEKHVFVRFVLNLFFEVEVLLMKFDICRIHMWLVWILSAGARHFIEILPMNLLDSESNNFNLEHHIGMNN